MAFIDDLEEAASDAVDAIGDAGDLIGGVLKSLAPVLAAIPGFGTVFAVAVYAAGALAAKDDITDAAIGTASAAMPPGLPRIAFDGATNITKNIANGEDVLDSAINACRQAAAQAGGGPASAAFESGLAMLRGGPVDQRLIDQARAHALTTGGQAAATSFDAGVSIARGNGADQVVLDAVRGYINQTGGSAALAAFDTGVALLYGKTLQEAAYTGLHTFARGYSNIEKILNFVEQVGRARNLRVAVQTMLESELATDFLQGLRAEGVRVGESAVEQMLAPYTDAMRDRLELLELPSGEIARQNSVHESIVRAAQALMRRGDGTRDEELLNQLRAAALVASQVFDFSERGVELNDRLAEKGRKIIAGGAKWRGISLSDIRKGSSFSIRHPRFDALTNTTQLAVDHWVIDDVWRRAFDIGIGAAEGTSSDHPAEVHANAVVRSRLAGNPGGFEAAEAIQYERTRFNHRFEGKDALSPSSLLRAAQAIVADNAGGSETLRRSAELFVRSVTRTSNQSDGTVEVGSLNRTKWKRILKKRPVPTEALLGRDVPKLEDPIVTRPDVSHSYPTAAR